MKVIMVMFDSLNRHFLPPYGCDAIHAPNFSRLSQRATTFDTSYVCSMPSMPARRDLHTGRPNFLHRSWGPLEPFDDSMPQILKENGVFSHLASDHYHYWEDGGATYHPRYSTWEFFRGQEGDPWIPQVQDPEFPLGALGRHAKFENPTRQDLVNRAKFQTEADLPQVQTFSAGLEFLERNAKQDNWFLQIETFDPHEPFFSLPEHRALYDFPAGEPLFDWPIYEEATHAPEATERIRKAYSALVSLCDKQRVALLTGQDFWRLENGAQLLSTLPAKFPTYPDLLENAGYRVGFWGKGHEPGDFRAGGRKTPPTGPKFENFEAFLDSQPKNQPFCFWFGTLDPHRPYNRENDSEAEIARRLPEMRVPPFLPDAPEIRRDLLDYVPEIENFDREIGAMLERLEREKKLENTLVVVTSDNGMPFPHAKGQLYDFGTRMPLVMQWPKGFRGGQTREEFVNLTDLAPTFLEVAGVEIPRQMAGRSLFRGLKTGRDDPKRDRVFLGRERHDTFRKTDAPPLGYPMRAVRTHDWLYIRNFCPERAVSTDNPLQSADMDKGPSRSFLIANREKLNVKPFYDLAFGARPAEELYFAPHDPAQLRNLAASPQFAPILRQLRADWENHARKTGDPRATGNGEIFESYPIFATPKGAAP